MTVPQSVDRQTFLANLRQSGLVTDAQLAQVSRRLPETNRGRLLARTLVELGLLTKFQAERLLIGRTSGFHLGQYRILAELGRGGMGRVYKAEHMTMKRVVALKVLASGLLDSDRARGLFLHEVQAVAQLVHPNIVTAYDASAEGGRYYLVLEFVDGPNLDQLVRRQGPLPVSQACDCIRQAANGLQCAHQLGMLHRDIKPANILVQWRGLDPDSPGLVKISDFGLARLQAPRGPLGGAPQTILTKENTVMGTPDFLSPEQARNLHKTDIRGDLYSLGCTFYYLLSGRVPFPGGTALEKLIRHSTEAPPPVATRTDVPEGVLAILHKLMAKRPEERFQTPAELAAALQPYSVTGTTPWAPLWSPSPGGPEVAESLAPESNPELKVSSSAEIEALANTGSNDLAATPLATVTPPPLPVPGKSRARVRGRRRVRTALLTAVALLAGVIAGLLAVGLLASRH